MSYLKGLSSQVNQVMSADEHETLTSKQLSAKKRIDEKEVHITVLLMTCNTVNDTKLAIKSK